MFRTKKAFSTNPQPEYKESKGLRSIINFIKSPKIEVPLNSREFVKYLSLSELCEIEAQAKKHVTLIRNFIKKAIKKDKMPTFDPFSIGLHDVFKFLLTPSGGNIGAQLLVIAISPFLVCFIWLVLTFFLLSLKVLLTGTVSLALQFNCSTNRYKSSVDFNRMPPGLIKEIKQFTDYLKKDMGFKIAEHKTAGDVLDLIESSLLPLIHQTKNSLLQSRHTFHLHCQRKSVGRFVKNYILDYADMLKPNEKRIVLKK